MSSSLAVQLLNILQTSFSPNEKEPEAENNEDNSIDIAGDEEADTLAEDEEEYYVCTECERLGIYREHNVGAHAESLNSDNRNEIVVKEEPAEHSPDVNESTTSNQEMFVEVTGIVPLDVKQDITILNLPDDYRQIEPSINEPVQRIPSRAEPSNMAEAMITAGVSEIEENADGIASEDVKPEPSSTSNDDENERSNETVQDNTGNSMDLHNVPPNINDSNVTPTITNEVVDPPGASHSQTDNATIEMETISLNSTMQSIGVQTEPIVDMDSSEDQEANVVGDHDANIVSANSTTEFDSNFQNAESTDTTTRDQETSDVNSTDTSPSPATSTTESQSRASSEGETIRHSTTASPIDIPSNSQYSFTNPFSQVKTPQIDMKQLLDIFQSSDPFKNLSEHLKSEGVKIVGENDPEFVNEMKDVKIKVETPHSIKQERQAKKRRSRFYSPPAKRRRRTVRKNSIAVVKTKTGDYKAFKEWDSDENIESD